MLLITGTVRIDEDAVDRGRSVMAATITASRAENGCLAYSYSQDVLDPGLLHINEAWRDRAALDAHFASRHIAEWRSHWADLGIRDRDLTLRETAGGEPV